MQEIFEVVLMMRLTKRYLNIFELFQKAPGVYELAAHCRLNFLVLWFEMGFGDFLRNESLLTAHALRFKAIVKSNFGYLTFFSVCKKKCNFTADSTPNNCRNDSN